MKVILLALCAVLYASMAEAQCTSGQISVLLSGDTTTVLGPQPYGTGGAVCISTSDARWTDYLAAAATAQANRAYRIAAALQYALGVVLTSTGSSSLNGTYSIGGAQTTGSAGPLDNINGLWNRAEALGTNFGPDGESSVELFDTLNSPHSFNSTQIISYGNAVAAYIAHCSPQAYAAAGNQFLPSPISIGGGITIGPGNTITIP